MNGSLTGELSSVNITYHCSSKSREHLQDDQGALIYVTAVLFIYSFSIFFMIGSLAVKSDHDHVVTQYTEEMEKIRSKGVQLYNQNCMKKLLERQAGSYHDELNPERYTLYYTLENTDRRDLKSENEEYIFDHYGSLSHQQINEVVLQQTNTNIEHSGEYHHHNLTKPSELVYSFENSSRDDDSEHSIFPTLESLLEEKDEELSSTL